MVTMEQHCKNCDHRLEPEHKYCPECGQKTNDELSITVLFNNTISNYFSVDARFFVSFFPLLFKPGYLPLKFVEGKRLKYLHPAQFYLFISVIFFFLLSFEARKQQESFENSVKNTFDQTSVIDSTGQRVLDSLNTNLNKTLKESGVYKNVKMDSLKTPDTIVNKKKKRSSGLNFGLNRQKLDSLVSAGATRDELLKSLGYRENQAEWKKRVYNQLLKFYEKRGGGLLQAFYDSIPIALFFLLPIYALLLKLFFLKKGRFSHHLVFSFYFFSFLFTVFSIMLLANFIYPIPGWIDGLLIFATAVYLVAGIRRFYQIRVSEAFIRAMAVSILYFLFVIPTSFIIISIVTFLLY